MNFCGWFGELDTVESVGTGLSFQTVRAMNSLNMPVKENHVAQIIAVNRRRGYLGIPTRRGRAVIHLHIHVPHRVAITQAVGELG